MDLNTILIILGVIVLIALIVHGLWSNRREKSKYFQKANKFDRTSSHTQPQESHHTPEVSSHPHTPTFSSAHQNQSANPHVNASTVDYRESEKSVDDIKITLPNPPVYDMGNHRAEPQPQQPTYAQYDMPMPNTSSSAPAQAMPKNVAEMTIEQLEARSQHDDFDGINSSSQALRDQLADLSTEEHHRDYAVSFNEPKPVQSNKPKQTSGYIQLYLIPEYQEEFNGLSLVQALENLGFILGDRDMFHRHLDLSVASPVLFTVANFEQSGRFDPENLTDFTTSGVVLFMELPSPGNNLANLRTMIRTARTLAKDLQGLILTEEQEIFTESAEQDYLSRVA